MTAARLFQRVVFAAATVALAHGGTITIGATTYTEGTTESLIAPFNNASGTATTNPYSGYVLLTVSGTGQTAGANYSDAFYFVSGAYAAGTPLSEESPYYELDITQGASLAYNSADAAPNLIVYDGATSSAVSPVYVPAYQASDSYTFAINTALISGGGGNHLYFGVNDGVYADNSGSFNVTVTQLTAESSSVPEPASLILTGFALLGAVFFRFRKA
jgi:hypothetical protein